VLVVQVELAVVDLGLTPELLVRLILVAVVAVQLLAQTVALAVLA
jgi:hypothetical protein